MSEKHALVVDDSRSARVVLRKMLEKHALTVETTDSAEEAIDFLSRHSPDIIFMDHMMPGMDGFQAIEQIKKNPNTAMIPIVMYTSQDGEVFVGQARALGAVDVLAKDIRPTQLQKVLSHLGLIGSEGSRAAPTSTSTESAPVKLRPASQVRINLSDATIQRLARETSDHLRVSASANSDTEKDRLNNLLEEQRLNLRQDILSSNRGALKIQGKKFESLEAQFHYLKDLLERDKLAEPHNTHVHLGWLLTLLLSVLLVWWATGRFGGQNLPTNHLLSDTGSTIIQLQQRNDALKAELESLGKEQSGSVKPRNGLSALEWAINLSGVYAYTTVPLDDGQLLKLRTLIDQLNTSGFVGTVNIHVHVGKFCLQRNNFDQLTLAQPVSRLDACEQIGLSAEDAQAISLNQSINFANYIASFDGNGDNRINLAVVPHGSSAPRVAYPDRNELELAGEWNRIATQNNRIEYEFINGTDG